MRALLRSTIEIANEGLRVTGEAVDGEDAVTPMARDAAPDRRPGPANAGLANRVSRSRSEFCAEHPEQTIILFRRLPRSRHLGQGPRAGYPGLHVQARDITRPRGALEDTLPKS